MSDLLSVKFTASNAVRGKRPYTIYEIEVRSSTTMPWLLYKRYRDFDNLHAQLQKLASNKDLESGISKLNLPPKRLVRSMAPDVVSKRQKELEGTIPAPSPHTKSKKHSTKQNICKKSSQTHHWFSTSSFWIF